MRAIPIRLLIHRVELYRAADEDRWGNSDFDKVHEITNVRLDWTKSIVRDKNNAEVQLTALMFYDCKNSKPQGIEFKRDDVIHFNGERFKVETIEPLYDDKKLHHIEVGLIKSA